MDKTVVAKTSTDVESANTSPIKSAPVRKISRFLVSPAILTLTNEKTVQHSATTENVSSPTNPVMVRKNKISKLKLKNETY